MDLFDRDVLPSAPNPAENAPLRDAEVGAVSRLAIDPAITSVSQVGGGRLRLVLRGANGVAPTAAIAEALLGSHGLTIVHAEPAVEVIAELRPERVRRARPEARPPRPSPDVEVTLAGATGPRALLRDDDGTFVSITALNRVSLLYYLAAALEEDRQAGIEEAEAGWRSNRQASVAVWGRAGRTDPRRLKSLTFNLRAELRAGGVDASFVDKRRGAVRIRARTITVR